MNDVLRPKGVIGSSTLPPRAETENMIEGSSIIRYEYRTRPNVSPREMLSPVLKARPMHKPLICIVRPSATFNPIE